VKVDDCELCGSGGLVEVLDLGSQPLCDDLVRADEDRECSRYPINIVFCEHCFTAHQRYQVPKETLFSSTYHYRSRMTADVLSGMQDLVASVEQHFGLLDGKVVLDIGCNDGSLLDVFASRGAVTFGIEPTGAALEADTSRHVILQRYFDLGTVDILEQDLPKIDVIVFTNVFAHIEDLRNLLANLARLMSESTLVVIENHYLGSVIKGGQFDTFYHEHPRTYSLRSFVNIAEQLGSYVHHVEFPSRYGGNIRVFLSKSVTEVGPTGTPELSLLLENERLEMELIHGFGDFVERWSLIKRSEIDRIIKSSGRLCAKAFPGRATIPITVLGLSENEIEAVYEKPGSPKIAHFVPGTRIPILSDDDLFPRLPTVETILNLAWHIPAEIERYLSQHGFTGYIVPIIER
jgi:SAM-dependent methyltransferase